MADPFNRPTHDRGAADANNFLSQLSPQTRSHEAGQDPFLSGPAHSGDFGSGYRWVVGKIVCTLPYVNWYLVQLDDARGKRPAFKGTTDSSVHPLGVSETSPLPPNSKVLCCEPPGSQAIIIVCVLPTALTDSNLTNSDWISQGSNTGFRKEKYYWDLLQKLAKQGGIQDFSDGRPNDATAAGEWGRMAESGLGTFVDSFMAYLRADEATGFYAFYMDQLARVAGHNLDIRSAGHEEVYRDDQGEFHYFRGESPYAWESLGAFSQNETVHRETDDHATMFSPVDAKFEPKLDDQQAFFRYREWGGYMGQGRIREVLLPPEESGLQAYKDRKATHGVFREHIAMTGKVSWQTAKGFDLVKRSLIPVAKQLKLPDDPSDGQGDDETNYKAAGALGSGEAPELADLKTDDVLQSVAALPDQHAVNFNWQSLHAFAMHQKDFYLPEESELPQLKKLHQTLSFADLKTGGWVKRPDPQAVRVDHRWESVDYYENTAGLSVTDDGGVVLFDGYGGEIRMMGGNIQISCPGNVYLQPGKSLVGLAGDDVCLRAQKSADLSAGNKDLRLYGRKNVQLLAEEGGMLLESRAESEQYRFDGKIGEDVESSGIMLKSGKSPIVSWSKGLYLRTGSSQGEVQAGEIVLDADKGEQPVRALSSRFDRQVKTSCADYFGIESVTKSNFYSSSGAQIGVPLQVIESLLVTGQAAFGSNVAIAGGHLATEYAEQASFFVAPLQDQALAQVTANLQQAVNRSQTLNQAGDTFYRKHTTDYYENNKPGNDQVQKQAGFSFRNEKQYGTDDFSLPQTRWQQMAQATGEGKAWEEKPLKYQEAELLPFPGKDAWEGKLLAGTPKYFNWGSGQDLPRGTGGAYAEPEAGKLNPGGTYLTITDE